MVDINLRTESVPLHFYGVKDEECAITPSLLKKFGKFMGLFTPIYAICAVVGYYVFQWHLIDVFFSITFITTILSVLTFFWDSDVLRGMIWSIIPGFWIFWLYWFIPWLISLPNPDPMITTRLFLSHLPMFVLFSYFMYLLVKKGKGTKWWVTAGCSAFWAVYLSVFKLIDDEIPTEKLNFYHGYFPYQWPLILLVIFASGIISTLIFYNVEIRYERKQASIAEK